MSWSCARCSFRRVRACCRRSGSPPATSGATSCGRTSSGSGRQVSCRPKARPTPDTPGSRMIAQAEHIPVHLGALPDAVAAVMRHDPGPDDVFVLNDPYAGGTHLPDVTLVSRTEVGFAVTRAHHADVGGAEPGSMPAGSRTLEEEGVVIPPTRLDDDTLDGLVGRMRNPEERFGDFRAQLAA